MGLKRTLKDCSIASDLSWLRLSWLSRLADLAVTELACTGPGLGSDCVETWARTQREDLGSDEWVGFWLG